MRKLEIYICIILLSSNYLISQSIKFELFDNYYKTILPVDSIVLQNMQNGDINTFLTDSIHFEIQTSINHFNIQKNNLELYPNPSDGILNVRFINEKNLPLIITDTRGKVYYNTLTNNSSESISEMQFDISGLSTGTYCVKVGGESKSFVKKGENSNNIIKMINNSSSALTKDNEIQSQFTYKYTIYSNGFHPKIYYTEEIIKDSIVLIEMSPVPSEFDYKHIRVEINIVDLKLSVRNYEHTGADETNIRFENYYKIFNDTLIIRNGIIKNEKNYSISKPNREDQYDRHSFNLTIDEDSSIAEKFAFVYEYDKLTGYKPLEYESNSKFKIQFVSNKDIATKINQNQVLYYNLSKDGNLYYYKEDFETRDCPGHYTIYKSLGYNSTESYIKVEFLE